jgi:hypothetical protein
MNAPDPAANLRPQLQQSPVQSQPLNTFGIHPDANHMDPTWSNHNGHLPIISAAGGPYGQPMNMSSHNWNGQPYYTGPNGQPMHSMQQPQQPQQPLQIHQPMQPAAMLYSTDAEKQRKAERNEEIKNRVKKGCSDSCRFAISMVACMACVGSFCCAILNTSF